MTYCHECGSEVAELDIFCPYCGISLSPVPVPGNEAEDEMASTVVMPLPIKLSEPAAEPVGGGTAAGPAAEHEPVSEVVAEEQPDSQTTSSPAEEDQEH